MTAPLTLERLPRTIELEHDGDGRARLAYVDQRLLPDELRIVRTGDWREVVDAVKALAVRGAPALGVAGAAAMALWSCNEGAAAVQRGGCAESGNRFLEMMEPVADEVALARPTAVNLAWGVRRSRVLARELTAKAAWPGFVADALFDLAKHMEAEDEAANRAIGANGAALVPHGARILTHCNAGSLATVFFGTALGVVYAAAAEGKVARVYADETRPVGQGARLTTWELARAGVPVTLLCDSMAASLMAKGEVDAVVVGADRIAANGDVANKVGTLGLAILACEHGVPLYVAAPTSTIDFATPDGAGIAIEERDPREVLPRPIEGVEVWNPAFDVTPARFVSRIVTERGAFHPGELAQQTFVSG